MQLWWFAARFQGTGSDDERDDERDGLLEGRRRMWICAFSKAELQPIKPKAGTSQALS